LTCGTSGTITLNTSYDLLAYTKIGRLVFVQGNIRNSAISSPLGSLTINLPFVTANLDKGSDIANGSISYYDVNAFESGGSLMLNTNSGSTTALIMEFTTTSQLNDVANHMKASSQLKFGFSYIAT